MKYLNLLKRLIKNANVNKKEGVLHLWVVLLYSVKRYRLEKVCRVRVAAMEGRTAGRGVMIPQLQLVMVERTSAYRPVVRRIKVISYLIVGTVEKLGKMAVGILLTAEAAHLKPVLAVEKHLIPLTVPVVTMVSIAMEVNITPAIKKRLAVVKVIDMTAHHNAPAVLVTTTKIINSKWKSSRLVAHHHRCIGGGQTTVNVIVILYKETDHHLKLVPVCAVAAIITTELKKNNGTIYHQQNILNAVINQTGLHALLHLILMIGKKNNLVMEAVILPDVNLGIKTTKHHMNQMRINVIKVILCLRPLNNIKKEILNLQVTTVAEVPLTVVTLRPLNSIKAAMK